MKSTRARTATKPPKDAFIRRVALSLPGASETYYKGPRFATAGSAPAIASSAGSARPGDLPHPGWTGETLWLFKLPHHQEMMLFDTRPETFTPMRSGPMLWCYADVRNLDAAELRDLIVAAWRTVAPKKLQAQHGETR